MRTPHAFAVAALAFTLGTTITAQAHEASGGPVRVVATIDSGGLVQSAGPVQNVGFVGQLGSLASAGSVVARQGANSFVFYPQQLLVEAQPSVINEAGVEPAASTRAQLGAVVTFDDDTTATLSGVEVTWTAPPADYPIASISAEGVAQADVVFEDTEAEFLGQYAGLSATNFLTVRNLLDDNYRQWAGDTFDDAWQIEQGMSGAVNPDALNNGSPNWLLYALGLNPEQPAPAVLIQSGLQDRFLTITYTRNTFARDYVFAPQETGNLRTTPFADLVNPVVTTNNISPSLEAITVRGSLPVNLTNRQFLRLRVDRPAP